MGILSGFRSFDTPKLISGDGYVLRFPVIDDFPAWAHMRQASRRFLEPWEPSWGEDDLTLSSFRQRLRRHRELVQEDLAYPYFLLTADGGLLGAVTLSNIRRGIAQMGTLGYWVGELHARQGHMTAALRLLLPHAFDHLHLHRVEAACLPRNVASIRLLERCGFEREGMAREYLKIAGQWEDHILFAKLRT